MRALITSARRRRPLTSPRPYLTPSFQPLPQHCVTYIKYNLRPIKPLNNVPTMPQVQTSSQHIPPFYRIFFTIIDPIICVWGAYMDFFDPQMVLSSHILANTPDIGHIMILKQRGGSMLGWGFISAFLLRYTQDIKIWHIVEIAILLVDFAYFPAVFGALNAQMRVLPETWRAEDWGSLIVTGTATLVRLAFLARLGFNDEDTTWKKTQ